MLSGLVFDLRNVPAAIRVIAQILPATHFLGLVRTLFMAGDYWPQIIRSLSVLSAHALLLFLAARRLLAKRLT